MQSGLAGDGVARKIDFARMIPASPSYVSRLIAAGKLTAPALRPDGLIDVRLGLEQLAAHRDPGRRPRSHRRLQPSLLPMPTVGAVQRPADQALGASTRQRAIEQRPELAPAPDRDAGEPVGAPVVADRVAPALTDARLRREQANAELAEIQLRRARGELVDVEAVRNLAAEVGAVLAEHGDAALTDLAHAVVGQTDLRAVLSTVQGWWARVREGVADGLDRRAAQLEAQGQAERSA